MNTRVYTRERKVGQKHETVMRVNRNNSFVGPKTAQQRPNAHFYTHLFCIVHSVPSRFVGHKTRSNTTLVLLDCHMTLYKQGNRNTATKHTSTVASISSVSTYKQVDRAGLTIILVNIIVGCTRC